MIKLQHSIHGERHWLVMVQESKQGLVVRKNHKVAERKSDVNCPTNVVPCAEIT